MLQAGFLVPQSNDANTSPEPSASSPYNFAILAALIAWLLGWLVHRGWNDGSSGFAPENMEAIMADKVGRREFIKLAAAGTAVTAIARRVKANSRGGDASDSAHRWAMVIDQAKCVGCAECSLGLSGP